MLLEYFEDFVSNIGPIDIINYRDNLVPDVTLCFITYCHEEISDITFQLFKELKPKKIALLDIQQIVTSCPRCDNPIFESTQNQHLKYCRIN